MCHTRQLPVETVAVVTSGHKAQIFHVHGACVWWSQTWDPANEPLIHRMRLLQASVGSLLATCHDSTRNCSSWSHLLSTKHTTIWSLKETCIRQHNHSSINQSIICIRSLICICLQCLRLLVGRQEGHLARKKWVMTCWCGYLSGVRCRLFAYGPADATAIPKPHQLLPHLNTVP